VNGRSLAAVVIIAGLAGAAGYYVYSTRSPVAPAAEALPGSATAPATLPTPAQLVATVPDFKLADRVGDMKSLHDWPGKSLIVNFWATWCAPCRREIPLLEKLQRDHAVEGFQVIGIAVDFRDKVLAYADEMKIQYPLLIGEQEGLDAASAFGIDAVGFPFTIFTDSKGRVIVAHSGELTAAEADLILDTVTAVNGGVLTPIAARQQIAAAMPALQHAKEAKIADQAAN
jgi:thiol-disulfide isomerase/thioredoxin